MWFTRIRRKLAPRPIAARLAGVPVIVHTIHGLLFHDQMPASRRRTVLATGEVDGDIRDARAVESREDVEVAIRTHLASRRRSSISVTESTFEHFQPRNPR